MHSFYSSCFTIYRDRSNRLNIFFCCWIFERDATNDSFLAQEQSSLVRMIQRWKNGLPLSQRIPILVAKSVHLRFSTFGPTMKKEPPGSRKTVRYAKVGKPLDDDDDNGDAGSGEWLVRWDEAILQYPASRRTPRPFQTLPFSMEIVANADVNVRKTYDQKRGCGHVLIGRNGSGKSLIVQQLVTAFHNWKDLNKQRPENPFLFDKSTFSMNRADKFAKIGAPLGAARDRSENATINIQCVSFDSHVELLKKGGSVCEAITEPNGGGQLSRAMRYFVVRFGLMPLLTQDVTTLSTGEIKKVLLIRALAQQPQLLILDNAFDGLDAGSRKSLREIIVKTLDGFRSDILVQGVSYKDAVGNASQPRTTQVLTVTHRPEEIVHQVSTVTFSHPPEEGVILTEGRDGRSPKQLLVEAMGETPLELDLMTPQQFARADNMTGIHDEPWYDESLPKEKMIAALCAAKLDLQGRRRNSFELGQELVQARGFQFKKDDKLLLSDLHWTLKHGQRWWISGLNGAGKSTLIQCIVSACTSPFPMQRTDDDESPFFVAPGFRDIGYISTNLHMSLMNSQKICCDLIMSLGLSAPNKKVYRPPITVINRILDWLKIPRKLLTRPFNALSQGEQRMMLIAGVFAKRPALLILDEPLQGLDLLNRHRVLGMLDRICCATNTSLLYVTHYHEDLIPSLTHVLHLTQGKVEFNGTTNVFDPYNTLWTKRLKPKSSAKVFEEREEPLSWNLSTW